MNKRSGKFGTRLGLAIFLFFLLVAIFADILAPYQMTELSKAFAKPSAEHFLGTNDIGQDIFSELILGTRASLLTGITAAVFTVFLGTVLGLSAGYLGDAADKIIRALISVFMAIPQLPLTIVLVAFMEPSIWNIILAIVLTSWTPSARIVRSKVMEIKQLPFVKIEETLGQRKLVIMFKHILPNIKDILLMRSTLAVSSAMLTEASLSFLGLGSYNQKSWGSILYYAFNKNGVIANFYWWYVPPLVCISLCIFAFILMGYYGIGTEDTRRKSSYEVRHD